MSVPHFFGYGSLVNRATHTYPVRTAAEVRGWRRVWKHSTRRKVAFLTVEPAAGVTISGLVAEVPGADWAALDAREHAYDRITLTQAHLAEADALNLHLYQAKTRHVGPPSLRHPVLLSYLDTVVEGYLHAFGHAGVDAFFETTAGWDAPILNDRAMPVYPRATRPAQDVCALVDDALRALSAQVHQ
ncbi:gamma-glutamylcyclotransferase family protein [Tropicimonas sp. S265A]|uniref:gamma-glutamylcyclotransferase family protein n=1 Tax=Tropicimonas sp. S265A TaxID=3415134 RepID=UPI003C7E5767